MGSNSGTGWPLTVRCAKCKCGRDWRRSDTPDTNLVRTGRTKPYKGGNRGARGLDTFHEYQCRTCRHVGWSRHVDITRKPLEFDVVTLEEIGARINVHLKRFEADPKINIACAGLDVSYYNAGADGHRGRFVHIRYISFQGNSLLSKTDAFKYLTWLDAGNVGRHYEALEKT